MLAFAGVPLEVKVNVGELDAVEDGDMVAVGVNEGVIE